MTFANELITQLYKSVIKYLDWLVSLLALDSLKVISLCKQFISIFFLKLKKHQKWIPGENEIAYTSTKSHYTLFYIQYPWYVRMYLYLIIWWVTSLGHQTDWSNHEVLYFKTIHSLKDQHCHNPFSCAVFYAQKLF